MAFLQTKYILDVFTDIICKCICIVLKNKKLQFSLEPVILTISAAEGIEPCNMNTLLWGFQPD